MTPKRGTKHATAAKGGKQEEAWRVRLAARRMGHGNEARLVRARQPND